MIAFSILLSLWSFEKHRLRILTFRSCQRCLLSVNCSLSRLPWSLVGRMIFNCILHIGCCVWRLWFSWILLFIGTPLLPYRVQSGAPHGLRGPHRKGQRRLIPWGWWPRWRSRPLTGCRWSRRRNAGLRLLPWCFSRASGVWHKIVSFLKWLLLFWTFAYSD